MSELVPFYPLSRVEPALRESWKRVASQVIDLGVFVRGSQLKLFEKEWARVCKVDYAVGVANGLDGLILALKALSIGPGKVVAVPSHTFIATWNAVQLAGATPLGVDVDCNGLIDLDILENLDTPVNAVIPVHMHGMMVEMPRLISWADKFKVKVIEDASQAHLASFEGKFAGTFGDAGVFSLYPTKNLGALGDAGVVISNSLELIDRVRILANYGADPVHKYHHTELGHNSRLDEIQASFLRESLPYLPIWNEKRKFLAEIYKSKLKLSDSLRFLTSDMDSVWHHFPVLVRNRSRFVDYLSGIGIGSDIHYPRLAANEYFQALGVESPKFPNGNLIADEIVSLPLSPWHTESEIVAVAEAVNRFFC